MVGRAPNEVRRGGSPRREVSSRSGSGKEGLHVDRLPLVQLSKVLSPPRGSFLGGLGGGPIFVRGSIGGLGFPPTSFRTVAYKVRVS
eukprot:3123758-Alexandrium_andersonii.AAC.1